MVEGGRRSALVPLRISSRFFGACGCTHRPDSAATTCLLALATMNGKWIVGGVGDGLALG